MTKKIVGGCNTVMEVTWLLALVSIPIYFNIYTARIFEPDKITLFRSLVVIMAGAWLIKGIALWSADKNEARLDKRLAELTYPPDGEVVGQDNRKWQIRLYTTPLLFPAYLLTLTYLIATMFSVVPAVSWGGSYERLQGTYTFLCYVTFFLVVVFNLREWRQIERIISFVLLANVPIVLYGILQHNRADPLPWQGDVTFRVTSTMGNAIFISAYLIMAIPFTIYRIITTGTWLMQNRALSKESFSGRGRDTALSWSLLYGGFILFVIGLFSISLNLQASYRPSAGTAQASEKFLLNSSNSGGDLNRLFGNDTLGPWWALPLAILLSFSIFFLFTMRRKGTDTNYLFRLIEIICYVGIFGAQFMVIVYSKSRGPQAGLLIALFIFPILIFARRKYWKLLTAWVGTGVVAGTLLLLFNLPGGATPLEPIFAQLRKSPEIARFGEFLEGESGTSRVRQLIWKTDFELFADRAQSDPMRLIIGHGPESMFFVAPPFYQPELGNLESRNAVPDRSHNGYLDSIVITGIVGLLTYLLLVFAMLFYGIHFLRMTKRLDYQILLSSLMAAVIAHQIEIQAGIQIVSSWMMLFLCGALIVAMGGLIKGSYDPSMVQSAAVTPPVPVEEKVVVKEPEKEAVAAKAALPKAVPPVQKQTTAASKAALAKATATARNKAKADAPKPVSTVVKQRKPEKPVNNKPRVPSKPTLANFAEGSYFNNFSLLHVPEAPVRPYFYVATGLVVLFALFFIYTTNITPVLADTAAKQGSNLGAGNRWSDAAVYFRTASDYDARQDRYRLFLGQAYLAIATDLNRAAQTASNVVTGTNTPANQVNTSTSKEKSQQSLEFARKSEQELLLAKELSPLNPDHYANLGRLYAQWSQAIEPGRVRDLGKQSVDWFNQATQKAPRNARLYSELASAWITSSGSTDENQLMTVNRAYLDNAVKAAEKSKEVDPFFDTARLLLADLYRIMRRPEDAAQQLVDLTGISPRSLGNDKRFIERMQLLSGVATVNASKLEAIPKPKDTAAKEDKYGYNRILGIVFHLKNDLANAEKYLSEAIKIAPEDPISNGYLALNYQKQNKLDLAKQYAQRASQLLKNPTDATRAAANINEIDPIMTALLGVLLT
jgi:tetratricopeptide (TPR) repeat protein/O-antigen ligase